MGLAILDLEDASASQLEFAIDTGSNPWYQLRFGRKAGKRDGFDEVDDVVYATRMARNAKAGWTFDTRTTVRVPADACRDARFAQLLTFKDEQRRSPALSTAVRLALGGSSRLLRDDPLALSLETAMTSTGFESARAVPCRTTVEAFALPSSVGGLLGELVKMAAPVVARLIPLQDDASAKNGQASGGQSPPANLIADILRAVLSAVTSPAPVATSGQKSLVEVPMSRPGGNRFTTPVLSRQQVFGIDDALLATMIGPVIQALPQLLNAAADQKLKLRQENNKLITDLMAGLDRRRMMELLAQARAAAPDNPALAALNGLFEGEGAPATTPTPATPVATGKSLALQTAVAAPPPPTATSSKAVLSFVLAAPQDWFGTPANVFAKGEHLGLRVKLDVGQNGPKSPLPKAIAHICVKDGTERVLLQKDQRLTDVAPGAVVSLVLEPGEVSHLPTGTRLSVAVQLRWPGGRPRSAYQASAMTDIVLVTRSFVRAQGAAVSGDRELVDMQTYRPFWNKVWESPTLHGPGADSSHWNLDAAFRYSVLFVAGHSANGLMQTKGLTAAGDAESPVARTEGRFKGGIELSFSEVNKLLPLWEGEQPLAPDLLEAFATDELARRTAGEMIHSVRLKGGKRQRGLVWMVPVFALHEFSVGSVEGTDDAGQVTKVGEHRVRFPVPSAVRVLAMKSEV